MVLSDQWIDFIIIKKGFPRRNDISDTRLRSMLVSNSSTKTIYTQKLFAGSDIFEMTIKSPEIFLRFPASIVLRCLYYHILVKIR
jgi:hypothetical protein